MRFAAITAMGLSLGLLLTAAPTSAQDAGQDAMARRFVEISLTGMDKVVQDAMAGVIGELPEDMEPAHRNWFAANAQPILMRHMRPLIDGMAAEYARRLTREELQALIDFYDTPQGRRIAYKQMEVSAAVGTQISEFQVGYVTELMTKFCAQFDCEGQSQSAAPANKPARR